MASIFCRYLDGTTYICDSTYGSLTSRFLDIKINGVSVGLTTNRHNVNSSDEVEFVLIDDKVMAYSFRGMVNLLSVTFGDGIKTIDSSAFQGCSNLTELVISDSVETIGYSAFMGCSNVVNITLGSGLKKIDTYGFSDCANLQSIVIPDSVIEIGNYAFEDCSNLSSITLGSGITTFGTSVFLRCESLPVENDIRYADTYLVEVVDKDKAEYTFKEGTKWIGSGAFRLCGYLQSIVIPDSVIEIGSNAFGACTRLKSITLNNSIKTINNSTFEYCSSLTEITIPDNITCIEGSAFLNCYALATVNIGSGLVEIGNYAFCNTAIKNVNINATIAPALGYNVFSLIPKNGTLNYPSGSDYSKWLSPKPHCLGYYGWNGVIPEDVAPKDKPLTITCTYNVTGRTSVVVTSNRSNLYAIIKNGVYYTVNRYAATSTSYSLSIEPNDVVELLVGVSNGAYMCRSNKYLKTVVMGYGIEHMSASSFEGCTSLESVILPKTMKGIVESDFSGCSSLKSIIIPNSVTYIGKYAFRQCTSLETVIIGNGLDNNILTYTVDYDAFKQCTSLKEIFISTTEEPTTYYDRTPFVGVKTGGTLYYPKGSDYSTWLSTDPYYLGYYEWNGVQLDPEDFPNLDEDSVFELNVNSIMVSGKGESRKITAIKQNISKVEVETPDGISVEETSDGFIVNVSANKSLDESTSEVIFNAYNGMLNVATCVLTVVQKGGDLYLNIEPDNISASGIGLTTNINVDTNATNVDVICPDWISVSKKDDTTYEVVISPEKESKERYGKIIFTASAEGHKDITGIVEVYQEAYEKSYIILADNEFLLNDESDTREMEVTYVNIASITPPIIPEGYEIIGEEKVEPSTNVVQVKYRVRKTSANVGVFTTDFKGVDGNGNTVVSEPLTVDGWPSAKKGAELDGFTFNSNPENDFHHILGMEDTLIFQYESETRYIDFNINGYTKPFEVTCTINDPNGVLTLASSEVSDDDGQDYAVYKLGFNSTGNSTNNPLEGTIDIHYTDEKTNFSKTIPFYVRFANQGLIDPFSNNYKFDKDGVKISNYNDIGVGYFNIQTINTPTCSPWISLSAPYNESTYYETGKSYRYDITVQPNDGAERTGVITFSGLGVDGRTWVAEVELFQEGNDTVQIIDEGFIELQSLNVVLPAEGGTDTFQVKYYDAYTIETPELVGNWASIKELSRTSENGVAWNGKECVVTTITYQVEVGPTTTGREMKVICRSKINYYDGSYISMEKDKFRIQQLAPGSTEWQGTVYPFRNEETYDTYGSGDTIRVAYKDVTILDPIVSADWVRIKTTTDKTFSSSEYDSVKEYTLEMDTNRSVVSRTATITFRGENEDGTKTQSIVTITQKGMEQKDDVGNYNNYKGYFTDLDNKLYSVSIITNPNSTAFGEIILAGDSPVVVSYSESERLYTPMRTSTCTVKVVSERYLMDIYTGKAQGTQVILKDEDTGEIKWCGFLQPNLYNQGFSAPVETIELEASDCLSTLQYLDYRNYYANGRMTLSFRDIIESILDRSKLINTYYLTQRLYSDAFQSRYLRFHDLFIAEQNFFSEEDEPWKLKEVLEEICKYMGLVCFQWGDAIYFLDYDMYDTSKKMIGYKFTKQGRWNDQELVEIANAANEIVAESYRGTGADFSLDDVFNKVSVNCSYYDVEDLIPDLFEDDFLTNRFGEGSLFSISRYTGRGNSTLSNKTYYRVYDHKNINSLYYLPLSSTDKHETKATPTDADFQDKYFFRKYVGGNIIDMIHLGYDEANGKPGEAKDWDRCLLISQLNRPWCGSEGTFHWEEYNFPIMEFKDLPVIFLDNTGDENVERTTLTRSGIGTSSSRPNNRQPKPVSAPNYLVIEASAIFGIEFNKEYYEGITEGLTHKFGKDYYNYGDAYTFNQIRNTPALCFYLEIPQAGWWDGSKWVHYKTHFEVRLDRFTDGSEDNEKYYEHMFGIEKNVYNTIETNLFLGTTGYKIPLPKEMTTTQQMYFAIAMPKRFVHLSDSYGGDYTGEAGNAYCFIKDFSMKIVNRNSALYEEEDVIYENIIDEDNVIDGDEIDLKITSDRYMGYSYSNVSTIKEDGTPTTDIMFYDKDYELVKPEEGIIERYVNQYSTPSIKTNLTLDMSFVPYELITDTYWNKNFVIIGQEIDYQMARQEITLLEKK